MESDASRKRHGKVSWKWCVMEASWKVVRHGSVMERCHGSDASRKRHGKLSWKRCVMESVMENVSWKRHGKVSWKWCVMEASWKGVMEVMRHGSVMERSSGSVMESGASRKRHGKGVVEA